MTADTIASETTSAVRCFMGRSLLATRPALRDRDARRDRTRWRGRVGIQTVGCARGNNRFPIWAADGKRIAFQSDREATAGSSGSRSMAPRRSA